LAASFKPNTFSIGENLGVHPVGFLFNLNIYKNFGLDLFDKKQNSFKTFNTKLFK
jgi:hypothetical protein